MSHLLLRSPPFARALRGIVRGRPALAGEIQTALEQLAANPFHPSLKTHKLKGPLKACWACAVGYDVRIVFSFVTYKRMPAVLLQTIGSHEDVY